MKTYDEDFYDDEGEKAMQEAEEKYWAEQQRQWDAGYQQSLLMSLTGSLANAIDKIDAQRQLGI